MRFQVLSERLHALRWGAGLRHGDRSEKLARTSPRTGPNGGSSAARGCDRTPIGKRPPATADEHEPPFFVLFRDAALSGEHARLTALETPPTHAALGAAPAAEAGEVSGPNRLLDPHTALQGKKLPNKFRTYIGSAKRARRTWGLGRIGPPQHSSGRNEPPWGETQAQEPTRRACFKQA